MASVVLVARIVLAAVFATAGFAKLMDRQGSRRALEGFGVPHAVSATAAVALPLAELATAIALTSTPAARWGALAALVLLVAFAIAIANALTRGQTPDCHCFGQLHSAPAGRGTLIRNSALAIPAGLVTWRGPGPAIDTWIQARTAAELVAVVSTGCAVLLAFAVIRLRSERQTLLGDLSEARTQLAAFPAGLPIGATAPPFALTSVQGKTVTLESLRARGRPVALMFVSPDCGPCEVLFPKLTRWQGSVVDGLTIAVISRGSKADNRAAVDDQDAEVLLQKDTEVMRAYRVGGTPVMIVVTPEGKIASAPAAGGIMIEMLVRMTLRRHATEDVAASPAHQPVA